VTKILGPTFFLLNFFSMKIIRRILFSAVLLASFLSIPDSHAQQNISSSQKYLVFLGTYTNKTQSKGIYAFEFDAATGKLTAKGLAAETPDPSWVIVHPNRKFLYAANETGKASTVSAFALDAKSGKLTPLNQVSPEGEDPCHLSCDRTGKYLFAANYSSGTVTAFPIFPDGKLGKPTATPKNQGKLGPNKERQEAPHAHWVEPSSDNQFVYVADLGLDRVLIYKFDAATGTLVQGMPADKFSAVPAPGTGPRHAAFAANGKFMYLLGEMSSAVTVFTNDGNNMFRSIQQISALPEGFKGRNDAAEIAIHPNGKFLYTANRGQDTIATFSINPSKGTLTHIENVPTQGKEPRNFAIDPTGRYLFAENQNSDTIVEFKIDPATGKLTPTGEVIHVPAPVCLTFLAN
jgi:6-phosphogluconolactonase